VKRRMHVFIVRKPWYAWWICYRQCSEDSPRILSVHIQKISSSINLGWALLVFLVREWEQQWYRSYAWR
jgi:hypothetical protein